MIDQLRALYEVQTLDVKMADIHTKLAAQKGARLLEQKLTLAKSERDAAEKALSDLEIDLKDSELRLKSVDEKRNTFEKRLYGGSINNPKELGAIEREIGMLKDQQGKLDGRTLELYDLVDEARKEAQAARKLAEEIEKKFHDTVAAEAADKTRMEAELVSLTDQRERAAASVTDKSLLSRYESVRKKAGGIGIALAAEGRCGGCHVGLTSFTVRKLYEGKERLECENCGRILLLVTE